jgi:glycosyltransferase involved in cell wall biosynthesis
VRKKVLFISYAFPPFGGGGEVVAYNVLNFLRKNDRLEIDILTSRDARSGVLPVEVEHVKLHSVPAWRKSPADTGVLAMTMFVLFGIWKIRKLLKKNNYDLIHYWASVPSGLLSFTHRGTVPYVVSLFGGDIPKFNPGQFQLLHFLLGPLNKSVIRNARKVTAMSRAAKQAAEDELGPADLSVVWNAADAPPDGPQSISKSKNGALRLISVGRLLVWKRFDMIIKALGRCNNVELAIVGDGPERKSLENLAERICPGRVRFEGQLEKAQVFEKLAGSDVFVLPSVGDSFGNVFVEAMACGLPVIGARAGGVTDIIDDGVNGFLIEPDNLDQLAEKIDFLKDAEERKRQSLESVRLFQEKFTWPRVFEKYQSLYKELEIV